jgi:hypothetical protein
MNIKLLSNYVKFLESVIIIQRWWRKYKSTKISDTISNTISNTISDTIETSSEISVSNNISYTTSNETNSNEANMDVKRYNLYRKRKYDDIYLEYDKENKKQDKKITKKKGIFSIFSSVLKFFKFK